MTARAPTPTPPVPVDDAGDAGEAGDAGDQPAGDAPLTDEYIKSNSSYGNIGELAKALASGETKLRDIPGLKPVLRLHPPRKGYKTTKRTFPQGGALGYYGQEINTLLYKMR